MYRSARRTVAAVATMAIGAAAVAAGATAANAAPDEESLASIVVEIDLPTDDSGQGPMVFSATDVVIGEGPELTGDDEIANPSGYCGEVEVDVDLGMQTITVSSSSDACNFETADVSVEITGDFILGGVELYSDSLFDAETELEYYLYDGTLYASWTLIESGSPDMNGAAVFGIVHSDEHPFIDVHADMALSKYNEHWLAIGSLGYMGIVRGWETPEGFEFRPYERTTRDALAAFMYRTFGDEVNPVSDEPAVEPFVDVSSDPDSPHYNEHWEAIYWMAAEGLAEGWPVDGGYAYRPTAQITRDAVAAFMFRLDGGASAPQGNPFTDVSSDPESADFSEHAVAIAWMYEEGLANGWSTSEGPEYRPTAKITRDAIAAFIYRTVTQARPS
ncbi:S-layer homology domain-containing protein [Demequina sp. SO4-13]|uniref:S-layer homology domain-containing protein n=1 Tax=Demequina sp. SO4-13 TaxID=3401027 RepID=UPI003AF6299D